VSAVFVVMMLVVIVGCMVLLYRNELVCGYRLGVSQRIYDDRIASINDRPNQGLTWDVLESVTYDAMLLHFWKPLDLFFPPEYRSQP